MPSVSKFVSTGSGVRVTVDDEEITKHLALLRGGVIRRTLAKALNYAAARAMTQAKRLIAEKRNIKVSEAGAALKLDRAATNRLYAQINATGKPIPLSKVLGSKKQTQKGVIVSPSKGRKTTILGAFIARMASGHVGIFIRAKSKTRRVTREKGDRTYTSELPIIQMTSPSVPATLVSDEVLPTLAKDADANFEKELRRLLIVEERGA